MCKLGLCERCGTEAHLLTGPSAASLTLHLRRLAERDKRAQLLRVSVSHVGGTDTFTVGPFKVSFNSNASAHQAAISAVFQNTYVRCFQHLLSLYLAVCLFLSIFM